MIELRYLPEELAMRWAGATWVNEVEMTFDLKVMGVTKYITMPEKYPHDLYSFFLNLRKADGTPSDASKPHDMGWDFGKWDDGSHMHFDDCNGLIHKYMVKEDQAQWKIDLVLKGVGSEIRRDKWKTKHGHD